MIKSALEYGFSHKEIILIATLTRYAKNKLPSKKHIEKYKDLLPDEEVLNTLSYLLSLSIALLTHKPRNIDFELEFKNGVLKVNSEESLYLAKESVSKLSEIQRLDIEF